MPDPRERAKELARAIWIKAFPTTDMVEEAILKAFEEGAEMYHNAWKRELGILPNKHHEIDALVLATQKLKEKADKWTAYENGILRRDPFWMVEAR